MRLGRLHHYRENPLLDAGGSQGWAEWVRMSARPVTPGLYFGYVNCPFCLKTDTALTREHLFSVPVCRAFRIDRDDTSVGSVDVKTGEFRNLTTLARRTVRLPCERCNSGWMSQLERDMGAIAKWLESSDPLGDKRCMTVQRWMLKMLVVLGFADGDSRRFFDTPAEVVIPDIGAAQAAMGNRPIPTHAAFGIARTSPGIHLYGVGNPCVEPSGPNRISSRAANVAAVNLGILQLWAIVALVPPRQIQLPPGVSRLAPRLRSASLRHVESEPRLELARVRFPDVDPTVLFDGKNVPTASEPGST